MHDALEQFVAFPQDGIDNRAFLAQGKLTMPVLALGGEKSSGADMATELGFVASDVKGGIVPNSGHWIMEENPTATTRNDCQVFDELEVCDLLAPVGDPSREQGDNHEQQH
jgi:pimeloyl-ACP methyl ester carboxylesterase